MAKLRGFGSEKPSRERPLESGSAGSLKRGKRERRFPAAQGRGSRPGRRNGPPATCHEMSCFVMRPAGNVMFCHGPPRLRLDRRVRIPHPALSFLHRVSFHSVPFLPPPAPPRSGSLFRAYRVPAPASARARASGNVMFWCAHFAPARVIARLIAPARAEARTQGARLPPVSQGFFRAGAKQETKRLPGCRLLPSCPILARIFRKQAPLLGIISNSCE